MDSYHIYPNHPNPKESPQKGLEKEITALINENNLQEIVKLKGYSDNMADLLQEYDIGINNSRGEGFGLSTAEFMCAGLCVMCADRGANVELVKNNINGIIFQYGNINDIAFQLSELMNNKQKLVQLGYTASEEARTKYSSEIMAENVERVYKSWLRTK